MAARFSFWRWAWSELSIHPYLKALYLIVYFGAIYIGGAALFAPPTSIEAEIGPFLTFVWGSLALVGGLFGAAGVIPGWWWMEKVAVIFGATALGLYLLTVAWLQATSPGNRWANMGLFIAWFALFGLRPLMIKGYSYEPRLRKKPRVRT